MSRKVDVYVYIQDMYILKNNFTNFEFYKVVNQQTNQVLVKKC